MNQKDHPSDAAEPLGLFQPKITSLRGEILAFLAFAIPCAVVVGVLRGASIGTTAILLVFAFVLAMICGAIVHWRRKRGLPTV